MSGVLDNSPFYPGPVYLADHSRVAERYRQEALRALARLQFAVAMVDWAVRVHPGDKELFETWAGQVHPTAQQAGVAVLMMWNTETVQGEA